MKEQSMVERPQTLAFDSTQTLRAVTVRELRDPSQQKWFAVQLVVSDRPVNLETMPRLDVFAAYRLYAVQGQQGSNTRYALRLGFFAQEETAQKICEYVKAFFRSPCVVRVSASEQVRFDGSTKAAESRQNPIGPGADVVDLVVARRAAPSPMPDTRKPASDPAKLRLDKSLSRELMKEARQVEISRSGTHRASQRKGSWVGKLLGRPKD
jgi:hypothetical protein